MRHTTTAVPPGYVPLSVSQSRITTWLWHRFPRHMHYERAVWLARRLP